MREIKYKALSKGKLYQCHACNFNNKTALIDVDGWHNPQWCTVEEFMQYTGLHDRLGKEIYEGDILKYQDLCNGIVTYYKAGFIQMINGIPEAIWKDCECIGNIYENKELLQ